MAQLQQSGHRQGSAHAAVLFVSGHHVGCGALALLLPHQARFSLCPLVCCRNKDSALTLLQTAARVLRDAGVAGEPLAAAEAALSDLFRPQGFREDAADHLRLATQVWHPVNSVRDSLLSSVPATRAHRQLATVHSTTSLACVDGSRRRRQRSCRQCRHRCAAVWCGIWSMKCDSGCPCSADSGGGGGLRALCQADSMVNLAHQLCLP